MTLGLLLMPSASELLTAVRTHISSLSPLARFAVGLGVVFVVPPITKRLRLPSVVGLLIAGILLGPYVFDIFGKERPVADFMADLGKLLLMFYAGLEVDLTLFRQSQRRVVLFGITTTTIPLVLGTLVGLWFGYAALAAIV